MNDKVYDYEINIDTVNIDGEEYVVDKDVFVLFSLVEMLIEENDKLKKTLEKEDELFNTLSSELLKLRNSDNDGVLCRKLELENENIIRAIVDSYNSERTSLGKSVLRQLMERLGWEITNI